MTDTDWKARAQASEALSERLRGALDRATEKLAEHIYNGWRGQDGWVSWVPHGNSFRQDDARREARAELSDPLPPNQQPPGAER